MSSLTERLDVSRSEERRQAVRALLMQPLIAVRGPGCEVFPLIRRHAEWLRAWFLHNPGWILHLDGEYARLHKVPADAADPTRGAADTRHGRPFTRRRYVMWCLALVVLERSGRQTALGRLAEDMMAEAAADPVLAEAGMGFDLEHRDQRADLVGVVRLLLAWQVLKRVHGDELEYLAGSGDALYTIHRPVLTRIFSVGAGPTLVKDTNPTARLAALHAESPAPGDEGRRRRLRTRLTRLLLEDPVVYFDDLDEETRAYLVNQRHNLTARIEEATGLVAEVRREGIALVDERRTLTDLAMPEEGTDGHAALLVAEFLVAHRRGYGARPVSVAAVEQQVATLIEKHGPVWRKAVREPDGARQLTGSILHRLGALGLIRRRADSVEVRPALARYGLDPEALPAPRQASLFGDAP